MASMTDKLMAGGLVTAAVLIVAGVLMVTVFDSGPDGPQEFENEGGVFEGEEADGGAGNADLTWWAGAGAITLGIILGVAAVWRKYADQDEPYDEY